MSSCTLQPFSLCVCFTRHFCCLPWVFRVMLCAESSQPTALHGLRWLGVAGCGYACWVCLTTTWWITSQLHPKRHTEAGTPAPSPTQLIAAQARQTTVLYPLSAWRLILTSQVRALYCSRLQREGKKNSKSTKEQRGGGRKLSHSPLLSGSLFFSRCDLCPWPGPIHVPQIAQLMPQ